MTCTVLAVFLGALLNTLFRCAIHCSPLGIRPGPTNAQRVVAITWRYNGVTNLSAAQRGAINDL